MEEGQAPATENTAASLVSPLSVTCIGQLWFYPSRYFSNPISLGKKPELWFVAWLTGISYTIGRVSATFTKAELGTRSAWSEFGPWLSESWLNFWVFVLGFGVLNAFILFYLGGWWYRKRLEWSGVSTPDRDLARQVYVYQDLVQSAPTLVLLAVETIVFSNYREAYGTDELWSASSLVFVFWSCWTSYVAATTTFQLSKTKARIWFLVLPVLLYVVTLGVIVTLYAVLTGNAS